MGHTAATRQAATERMANGETLASVHHDTGIPRSTLSDWAAKAGLDLAEQSKAKTRDAIQAAQRKWAELRADTANDSGSLAHRIIETIAEHPDALVPSTARDVKDLATAAAILIDKAQVLGGDAADRVEHVGLRDDVVDRAKDDARHLRSVPA